jgi:hypothetical protein
MHCLQIGWPQNAAAVLHEKFGLEKTRALWNLLFEIPFRYRLYRKAFEAETRGGCVDRTVARLAKEGREAGDRGLGRKPRLKLLREAPISAHP